MQDGNVIDLNSRRPKDHSTEHDAMNETLQMVFGYDEHWHQLADAHENEVNSKGATFFNFGWVTDADCITSKTSRGILTTYRSKPRGKAKHDWLTYG
jgi:hypothetical protein